MQNGAGSTPLIDGVLDALSNGQSGVGDWVEREAHQLCDEIERAEDLQPVYDRMRAIYEQSSDVGARLLALLYFSRGDNRIGLHNIVDSVGLLLSSNMSDDLCRFLNRIYRSKRITLGDDERTWWKDHCSGWGCPIDL